MAGEHIDHIRKLAQACAIQAAIVAARQEGAEVIALELEDVLTCVQPGLLVAV